MNNTTNSFDDPPFKNPAREREWQAQERAQLAERNGSQAQDGDARIRQYRLISRALREAPAAALPPDFAASLAQRAQAPHAEPFTAEPFVSPFERRLLQILVALFGIVTGVCAAAYAGADAFHAISHGAMQASTYAKNSWLLALLACLVLSAGMQFWHPRRH
jgi:hypothetical protein